MLPGKATERRCEDDLNRWKELESPEASQPHIELESNYEIKEV
jgi:hypothetical protein